MGERLASNSQLALDCVALINMLRYVRTAAGRAIVNLGGARNATAPMGSHHHMKLDMQLSSFHSSSLMCRKTGSKALEPEARMPSKKQAKRKAREEGRSDAKVDHKQLYLKKEHMKEQFESDEMTAFMDDLRARLDNPIMEALLPGNSPLGSSQIESSTSSQMFKLLDPFRSLNRLTATAQEVAKQNAESAATESAPASTPALVVIDDKMKDDANLSLVKFSQKKDIGNAMKLYNVMNKLSVPVHSSVVATLMEAATKAKNFQAADAMFNEAVSTDGAPVSMDLWSAKISTLSLRGEVQEAEELLNQLRKLKLKPLPAMYSNILGGYVRAKDFEKAYKIWLKMHLEDVDIDRNAFNHMFKYCALKKEAERAFFYMDEMRVYNLEPDLNTFRAFFEAASMAPHFVPGYQDTMFDAMAIMEGKELAPNSAVYESLIMAFAQARDPVAAEYYFWEMKRKGLKMRDSAYENLLEAYMMSQTVGANKYGCLGRYTKPAPRKLTRDEQAMVDIGPARVATLLNEGVYTDYEYEHGKQRVKSPKIMDMYEEDSEGEEHFLEAVRRESAKLRREAGMEPLEEDEDDWIYEDGIDRHTRQGMPILTPRQQAAAAEVGGSVQLNAGAGAGKGEGSDGEEQAELDLQKVDLDALADGDEGFKELLQMMRDDKDGAFDGIEIDGMTVKQNKKKSKGLSNKKTDRPEKELTETEKQQIERARDLIHDLEATKFSDPFAHVGSVVGAKSQAERLEAKRQKMKEAKVAKKIEAVSVLDGDFGFLEKEEPKAAVPEPLMTDAMPVTDLTDEEIEKRKINGIIDTSDQMVDIFKPSSLQAWEGEDRDDDALITLDHIDKSYDMVYFGRAPDADYSSPLGVRRKVNIHRAELAFQHMLASGIKPTTRSLQLLLGVYSEAGRNEGVQEVLGLFEKYKLDIPHKVYKHIVTMHVRNNDLEKVMDMHAQMIANNIVPDAITYGLLIQTHLHREKVFDSLKLLEEATSYGVRIPERNLRLLRNRCKTLGIQHPDIRPDPHEWVKEVKKVRRNHKHSSQRVIQSIKSLTY